MGKMKSTPLHHFAPLAIVVGSLLSSFPAAGQSAEGFDASGISPELSDSEAALPEGGQQTEATPDEPIKIEPSRYAGLDIPSYVATLSARCAIRTRQTDPFGRYQDPDFKAPEPKILASKPTRRFTPAAPIPFSDIVNALEINMVTAEKQQFLIGDRAFKKGATFPIRMGQKLIQVQVVSVSAAAIQFKNLDSGESASLSLNMMPSGMQKGTDGIHAPGIKAGGRNAPIEIQPVIPLSNNR